MNNSYKIGFIRTIEEFSSYDTYNGNSLSCGFSLPEIVYCYCDFKLPYDGYLHYTKEIYLVNGNNVLKPDNAMCNSGFYAKVFHISKEEMLEKEIEYLKSMVFRMNEDLSKISHIAKGEA